MKLGQHEIIALTLPDGGELGVDSLSGAERFTRMLALGHYENFPVGSALIPKEFRQDFFNVYAFSRLADDVADELTDYSGEERIAGLDRLEKYLMEYMPDGDHKKNPVLLALHHSMEKRAIPPDPFRRLLTAFRMDSGFVRPETIADLEHYCFYSANPVGEIILRLFVSFTEESGVLSDNICTGLQLANFWQDLSVDTERGRLYIPREITDEFSLDETGLRNPVNSLKLRGISDRLCDLTEGYFRRGEALLAHLPHFRLKAEIALTLEGGRAILDKVRDLKEKIFFTRPALHTVDGAKILWRSLLLLRKY